MASTELQTGEHLPMPVSSCRRCSGTGRSPVEAKKFCRDCYGLGVRHPDFNYRADGRVEQMCDHGVGHTISIKAVDIPIGWDHGCDGCCKEFKRYP